MKNVPFLEAIVGSRTKDLHTRIFEIEVTPMDLFDAEEGEVRVMWPSQSRESLNVHRTQGPYISQTRPSAPPSPISSEGVPPTSPGLRHRSGSRQRNPVELSANDLMSSPLARIYNRRPLSVPDLQEGAVAVGETVEDILSSIRKVEHMMEGMNELPVGRLRGEIKDLQVSLSSSRSLGSPWLICIRRQDRQVRIETLLMTLTRGMRGDTNISRSATH